MVTSPIRQYIAPVIAKNIRVKELLASADNSDDPLVIALGQELEAEINYNDGTMLIDHARAMADEIIEQITDPNDIQKLINEFVKPLAGGKVKKSDMVELASELLERMTQHIEYLNGSIEYAKDIKRQNTDPEVVEQNKLLDNRKGQ